MSITGLHESTLQIAVWQSPSERWGSCHISRDGLWIIAGLGLVVVYRHESGAGTPVISPLRCGGSCISAMFAFVINLESNRVDKDRLDLCVFSWKMLVCIYLFYCI